MTVDMHANLELAAGLLEERLGIRTSEVPVIYMLGDQSDFEKAERAAGVEPGWEAGFFQSKGEYRGIFIQSDTQQTNLYHALTHEYVHFLMHEIARRQKLPAWLNEGLAGYYEFEVGSHGDFPDASYTRMLRSADRAQSAAADGQLLRLPQLESQREWNNRANELVPLQYAQSHMAVRYLSERYGEPAPIRIVQQIGSGNTITDAVEVVTGVSFAQFESDFANWLILWDDPDRAIAQPYLQVLSELADEEVTIRELRSEVVREWNLNFNRVKAKPESTERLKWGLLFERLVGWEGQRWNHWPGEWGNDGLEWPWVIQTVGRQSAEDPR